MRALEELLIPGRLCPLPLSPALLPGFDKVLPRLERGDAASVVAVGLALHTLLAGLAAVRLESTAPPPPAAGRSSGRRRITSAPTTPRSWTWTSYCGSRP